jgi:mannose-6-phosphate isomerase
VHPSAAIADRLGGEAKTEMWYIAEAEPDAELFVGLKRGVTRAEFERRIGDGTVVEALHRVSVRAGDSMFLPGGRVHAVGAGLVIFEIQQNSDTTYRVFDWNRTEANGERRELHVAQSLAAIDFGDFEPALVPSRFDGSGGLQKRSLAHDASFHVDAWRAGSGAAVELAHGRMQIIGVVEGTLEIRHASSALVLRAGHFCLVPASLDHVATVARDATTLLQVTLG